MAAENDAQYRQFAYHASRIPALDALSAFVADGAPDPAVQEMVSRLGMSRWYPENGGHRVLILYEGGPYDSSRFSIEKGAWDHEHCKRCGERIPSMSLCWMSTNGPCIILCESCHKRIKNEETAS
jgi:hypothetical protein